MAAPMHLKRRLTVVALSAFACLSQAHAAPGLEPLAGFDVGPGTPEQPQCQGPLYLHSDGSFYGVAGGGAFTGTSTSTTTGKGTVFRVTPTGQFDWASFTGMSGGMVGQSPSGSLVMSSDGWLWGTTTGAGNYYTYGTIYRMRPGTFEHQVMATMNVSGIIGSLPQRGLTPDGTGWLWGVTPNGGTSDRGVIYKIHESSGQYVAVVSAFTNTTGATRGTTPNGELYYDGSTYMWGVTSAGGSGSSGTVFKVDHTTGAFTTLGEFTGTSATNSPRGTGPNGRLVPDGHGFLWGSLHNGAAGNGALFKVEMSTGTVTTVFEFTGNTGAHLGANPRGSLVPDAEGNLWGVTALGGTNAKGTIFKLDPVTPTLTTMVDFGTTAAIATGLNNPINPLANDGHGYLWGMASSGASSTSWSLYKVEIATGTTTMVTQADNTGYTPRGTMPQAGLASQPNSDWLYGTTASVDSLFRINSVTGKREQLVDLRALGTTAGGQSPSATLHFHTDGTLWGCTTGGGAGGYGAVFKYDPATSAFSIVASFTGTSGALHGAAPKGILATGKDGFIWGTTSTNQSGNIFKIDPATNQATVVKTFTAGSTDGDTPLGGLTNDGHGILWGTTSRGGAGYGTVYKIDSSTGTFTVMLSFTGATGAVPGSTPIGNLIIDNAGNIWGMTNVAVGTPNVRYVFKFNPTTKAFTNVFTEVPLVYPRRSLYPGTLAKGADGSLWFNGQEVIDAGNSSNGRDVVYRIDATTGTVTLAADLTVTPQYGTSQLSPIGALCLHNDGLLYGVTNARGTDAAGKPAGKGMIYRIHTGQPVVVTAPPDASAQNPVTVAAQGRGSVSLNSSAPTYQFEWGPTTALGQITTATAVPTGSVATNVSTTLPQLGGRTSYYYRIRVNGPTGPVYGGLESFETSQVGATNGVSAIWTESPIGRPLINSTTTVDMGKVLANATSQQPVLIRDVGTQTLGSIAAAITGPSASQFSITTAPATAVTSLSATAVVITYAPTSGGVHTATLTITSNDAAHPSFVIPLTGTGIVQPHLVVEQPVNAPLANDGQAVVDFGSHAQGVGTLQNFVVRNTGNTAFASLSATVTGANASDFAITTSPSTTLAAGSSGTLGITFTPSIGGSRSAVLHLTSDDPDNTVFDIQLTGSSPVAPEITVEENGVNLVSGSSSLSYGTVTLGHTLAKTFTIHNIGTAPLTGVGATTVVSGIFVLTTAPASTVAPGGSTTFVVTFTPASLLPAQSALNISSNDADENPFSIHLDGFSDALAVGTVAVQPASALLAPGQHYTLAPTILGTAPFTYVWRKNGVVLAGKTAATLDFPSFKAADVGAYTLTITNEVGSATSQYAFLALVTQGPAAVTIAEGGTFTQTATVTAPAGPGISYQWKLNGSDIITGGRFSGTAAKALKITGLVGGLAGDSGTYTCALIMTPSTGAPARGTTGDTVLSVAQKPVIPAFTLNDAQVSESISFDIPATNSPTQYIVTGLPPGVVLNAATGHLSGKPAVAKTSYTLHVSAKNLAGTSAVRDVTWTITGLDTSSVGEFNGLVNRDGIVDGGFGGAVQVKTDATGHFTGSVTLGGLKYAFLGALDASSGHDPSVTQLVVNRTAPLTPLALSFTLPLGSDHLTGTIQDKEFYQYQSQSFMGDGTNGNDDGLGSGARFQSPSGIVLLAGGGGYVADADDHVIRAFTASGQASLYAGLSGTIGTTDGSVLTARFHSPTGLAMDSLGNLYVADSEEAVIRKITPAGVVSTFAGTSGVFGSVNGLGAAARFRKPCAIAIDSANNLLVVDKADSTLRKITPAGLVSTLAGKSLTPAFLNGAGAAARFNAPEGIAYDATLKAFFVADTGNAVIRKVTTTGVVTTYAGSPGLMDENDGLALNARFRHPVGIASAGNGTLYVADTLVVQISKGTVVGTVTSAVDPLNTPAQDAPHALAVDASGTVYAADPVLHRIVSHARNGFVAPVALEAWRNLKPVTYAGSYTAGLDMDGSLAGNLAYPQGSGYATFAVATTGVVTLGGKMPDGTAFTGSMAVGPQGQLPLQVMLYANTSSLTGWQTMDNVTRDVGGTCTWSKISQPLSSTSRSYKAGFPAYSLTLVGGKYTPVNNVFSFLGLAAGTGNAELDFAQGGLAAPFTQVITITAPSTISGLVAPAVNPNTVKLTITPANGLFTGSFVQPGLTSTTPRTATIFGVLVRNTQGSIKKGYGAFVLPMLPSATPPVTTTATSPILSGKVGLVGR